MKLSELIYRTIKNSVFYNDSSFTLDSFKLGEKDDDVDYGSNIQNCFSCINEAIARLSDLNRIPYFVCQKETDKDGIMNLTDEQKQFYGDRDDIFVKEIMTVADKNCLPVGFSTISGNIIRVDSKNHNTKYFVEFKEDIKHFDRSDYEYRENDGIYDEDIGNIIQIRDIDLRKYNINDSMCNYIMEYAMGRLLEDTSPELANMHITRAEQYFANINPVKSAFVQKVVQPKYTIGD